MKIVILSSFTPSLVNFRFALLTLLKEKKLDVYAFGPSADIATEKLLKSAGIKFSTYSLNPVGINIIHDVTSTYKLYKKLKALKPDIVLSYTAKPVIYGSIAAKLAGTPNIFSIMTGLGYAFTERSIKSALVRSIMCVLYWCSLPFNKRVFFQNTDDRNEFLRRRLVRDYKTALINGSGVDCEHYAPMPLPSAPTFLLIARLLANKGIYEYIEAAKSVKKVLPDAQFLLVGPLDPNPAAVSEATLKSWCDMGVITYLGEQKDVRVSISKASVYVLPSYREGTPRSVLEAMSMGRPIITTDAPGCRGTVIDGENGYLVPVKSTDELAQAMIKIGSSAALREQMGKRSLEIAREKYDVHKVNQVILNHIFD